MTYQIQSDGTYHIPVVDLGKRLRDNFGLTIVEHPEFGGVTNVHADNSHHYHGEAIDVQDWRGGDGAGAEGFNGVGYVDRTKNLRDLLRGSGNEVIGPGDMKGHDSHLHLGAYDGIFKLNEDQYSYLFGGNSGGESSTFAFKPSPTSTDDVPDTSPSTQTPQQEAVERVTNYKEMSKSQIDNAYDKMRADDPNKAAIEGMKMHKAFFNK